MSFITLIVVVGVFAILGFAIKKHVDARNCSIEIKRHARALIDYIQDTHTPFLNLRGDVVVIDNAGIELEFCKLPQYRVAFAEMNVSLETASLDQQRAGFSHALNYYGNQVLVKNYVDITHRSARTA